MCGRYLPSEREEVHDVVEAGGALQLAAVDVHRLLELVGPRAAVDTQRVHVQVRQVHQPVHQAVEVCEHTPATRPVTATTARILVRAGF